MDNKLTVAHLSGGYDSAAAIILELLDGWDVLGLFVDYGQPYFAQERKAAQLCATSLHTRDFPGNFKGLIQARASMAFDTAKDYVPIRNLVLTTMAAQMAVAYNAQAITVGNKTLKVRKDDPYSFSDCSVSFYSLLQAAIREGQQPDQPPIEVRMPLVTENGAMSKVEVVDLLVKNAFAVTDFWSCYKAGHEPCGSCYHCQELQKALQR